MDSQHESANGCTTCNNTGHIGDSEYCNCDKGVFIETKDEINLQISEGELDIGLDTPEYIKEEEEQKWIALEEEYSKYIEELYTSNKTDKHDNKEVDSILSDTDSTNSEDDTASVVSKVSDSKDRNNKKRCFYGHSWCDEVIDNGDICNPTKHEMAQSYGFDYLGSGYDSDC